jgi:type II secretory ATPase GspE/PulE/Tfp pilus assembly ATPase PilB-like protein
VVLITGHTGAGKTMTLYSLVNELNRDLRQVCSIEDPVEYELNGVRQLQVDPSSGFYMPEGMRTLLRMDPDVIVVGEVRDTESAVTAVRAGVSGRLVTCTIHARNCAMAVDMLQYYQVPAKLLGNTLRLIVAQDLIRVLCSECAGERDVRRQDALLFEKYDIEPPKKLRTPEGCQACHGFGYRGRRGVFQVVPVDSELAQKIGDGVRGLELEELIGGKSIQTLEGSALQLARQGITTLEESIKVLP